ncbi:MAG: hypothetical protein M1818_001052 [Claussenomyces sp. TS43310]|nr:MAG: hypothetical protein M1818_001052 [Claussenomyces sp. TS43310]
MPRSMRIRSGLKIVQHILQPPQGPIPKGTIAPADPRPSPTPNSFGPKSRNYLDFPPSHLSKHWDTIAPTSAHLRHAEKFFTRRAPTFLWSAPKFHSMSFGESPEVCFLGRSNVGKSSLLNALLGRRALAHVSSKPGRTQSMNAFGVGGEADNGKNRLVVLDMPGYGKGGRAAWGAEILKYLNQRKQLKRAFLLVDAAHGIKTSDEQLLALFRQNGVPHQIILLKVDRVLFPNSRTPSERALEARFAELRRTIEAVHTVVQPSLEDESAALGEIIACSTEGGAGLGGKKMGIDAVRHAMLQAAGLEYKLKEKPVAPVVIVPHDEIWQQSGDATRAI